MDNLVPLIDIAQFERGAAADRRAIARQVDAAARHVGFMQITGHGIVDKTLMDLTDAMDSFFAQPLKVKEKLRSPHPAINRGYTSPLSERLSYSAGVVSSADLFEAFNIGSTHLDYPNLALDPIAYPDNVWPDSLPECQHTQFQQAVSQWFKEAARVARLMTRIFEIALDLPTNYFAAYQDHSLDVLRLNHYALPSGVSRITDDQMGMGAHTDYGIVTVLWADQTTPGLQTVDASGHWIDVVPTPSALLINLGDLLARWTNDRWRSTLHRVLPSVDASAEIMRRRSAAFFHDGNADATIECLASCVSEVNPAKYAPVQISEHLAQKLAGSRGLELNQTATREAERIKRAV